MSAEQWMRRCLDLAVQAQGRTAPNPMVGALIMSGGEVIGEGWHRQAGDPHAEVVALRAAGDAARGQTMVVSLEPCCHHGRTPPCTDAILNAGISKVIVGMVDPDPRMQGRAISLLREAGLEVQVGVLEEDCRRLNRAYVIAKELHRPMVVLKAALSLDGRIASASGESQWITCEASRNAGHALRDIHDAILVGSGTLLADDPALNTRVDGGRNARPVVLDTQLRCPADAQVLGAGLRPVIYCGEDAPERDLDAILVRVPSSEHGVAIEAVLADLVGHGVLSVLVEGGGRVHHSLVSLDLVDQIHLFIAPLVLAAGPGWVRGQPFSLGGAPRFRVQKVSQLGDDIHLVLERSSRVEGNSV